MSFVTRRALAAAVPPPVAVLPLVSIAVSPATQTEAPGVAKTFVLTATRAPQAGRPGTDLAIASSIPWSAAGRAAAGATPFDLGEFSGPTSGLLVFLPGATMAVASVTIQPDTVAQGTRAGRFTLGTPSGCVLAGGVTTADFALVDDDTPVTPPPPPGTLALGFVSASGNGGYLDIPAIRDSARPALREAWRGDAWYRLAARGDGASAPIYALGDGGEKRGDTFLNWEQGAQRWRVDAVLANGIGATLTCYVPFAAVPNSAAAVVVYAHLDSTASSAGCLLEVRGADGTLLGSASNATATWQPKLSTSWAGRTTLFNGRFADGRSPLDRGALWAELCAQPVPAAERHLAPVTDVTGTRFGYDFTAQPLGTAPGALAVPSVTGGAPALACTGALVYDPASAHETAVALLAVPEYADEVMDRLPPGGTAPLPATATNVWGAVVPGALTVQVTGGVGTYAGPLDVEEFTAATVSAVTSGTLTFAAGGISRTVAVTVRPGAPPVAYGRALLPGPRFHALKAWAEPTRTKASFDTIPAQRRFTPSAMTAAAFKAAMDAAFAATGGDRLVILPDNWTARITYQIPQNADPAHDVILTNARRVAGTEVYTRYTRVSKEAPAWVPRLRTALDVDNGGGNQAPIFYAPNGTNRCGLYVEGVDLRTEQPDNHSFQGFAFHLVVFGDGQQQPGDLPTRMALSHVWFGGHAFDKAGRWNAENLGRAITDEGAGFALLDYWDTAHGANGGNGKDRGILSGIGGQGPSWECNGATDYGGGICGMYGGGDIDVNWRGFFHADVMREHNYRWRDPKYRRGHAGSLLDVDGLGCPWTMKNQEEIKHGWRHYYRHNLYEGHYDDGTSQYYAVALKSHNQDRNNPPNASRDLVFIECVILSACGGLQLIAGESYRRPDDSIAGGFMEPYQRVEYRNNLVVIGCPYPGGVNTTGYADGAVSLQLVPGADARWVSRPRDLGFERILADYWNGASGEGVPLTLTTSPIAGRFRLAGNVFGWVGQVTPWSTDTNGAFGLGQLIASGSASVLDVAGNVCVTPGGNAPAADAPFAAQQTYAGSLAAMGVTRNHQTAMLNSGTAAPTSLASLYTVAVNAPLRTAYLGQPAGPADLAALLARADRVRAGVRQEA